MARENHKERFGLSGHRFVLTLALATAGHAAFLSLRTAPPCARASTSRPVLEVELLPWPAERPPVGLDVPATPAVTQPAARATPAGRPESTASTAGNSGAISDPAREMDAHAAAPASAPPSSERRPVRLFLGAKDLAELGRADSTPPSASPRSEPSVGLITEGLAAADAQTGLSRSSAAVTAGYQAAELGPDVGTAILEVRTDARGAVTSVRVLGEKVTGAWSLVADTLLSRLRDRLLRVPQGARGLRTRLRIDRGRLVEHPSARRTPRGTAVGQDHHPKDLGWDESTQASMNPGRLSPSLGLSSDDLRRRVKTRVIVLSEEPL